MRLIDADVIEKFLDDFADSCGNHQKAVLREVKYALGHMPTIDAEPVKHGHWIFGQTMGHSWMKCSECCVSQSGQTATFTYCPNCGADMRGEQDE